MDAAQIADALSDQSARLADLLEENTALRESLSQAQQRIATLEKEARAFYDADARIDTLTPGLEHWLYQRSATLQVVRRLQRDPYVAVFSAQGRELARAPMKLPVEAGYSAFATAVRKAKEKHR